MLEIDESVELKVLPEWQKFRSVPSLTDLISVLSPFTSTLVLSRKKSLWWLVWISKFGSTSSVAITFAALRVAYPQPLPHGLQQGAGGRATNLGALPPLTTDTEDTTDTAYY